MRLKLNHAEHLYFNRYFAAPQENRVNIYEDILHYDEIEN